MAIISRVPECSTASTTQAYAPFQATFTNQTPGATSFLFDFGDGATFQEEVPSHLYSQEGRFKVVLTVYYGNDLQLDHENYGSGNP